MSRSETHHFLHAESLLVVMQSISDLLFSSWAEIFSLPIHPEHYLLVHLIMECIRH